MCEVSGSAVKEMAFLTFGLFLIAASSATGTEWDGLTPWFSDSTCNCNGFSNRCYFDPELFNKTHHGGHCIDCQGNRAGPNCERCRDDFYQPKDDTACYPCNCNEIGSRSLQCNSEGRCQCHPGVTGDKCDSCDTNHYDFSRQGCKKCDCYISGSYENVPSCDPVTGTCRCKENVEGIKCKKCKPGYFNLDLNNEYGCTPCFCYGHSSVCTSAPGYARVSIESSFIRGNEKWQVEEINGTPEPAKYHNKNQTIEAVARGPKPVFFVASDRYLHDQRASYNQDLEFKLRIGESAPRSTIDDIILEGGGFRISQYIGLLNPLPSEKMQSYKFRLHENPRHGWKPRLDAKDFISLLANLTALKIKGTYTPQGVGFLDDVKLDTARRGSAGYPANWLEMCTCPDGYVGEFCESCKPGFRHDPASKGPFAPCVRCNCNGHADLCDSESGRCICQHNTAGENCERCAHGYYGNALSGSPYGCKLCPCPNQGACIQVADETIVCLECPTGYGGPRCELCRDGYFGDPAGRSGPVRFCQPCDCSQNVDPNAIGNCNHTSGECLKCIYNTGGPTCAECLPGFYGDALALPKGDCKPCQCNNLGTVEAENGPPICDQLSGQCQCKPHVVGTNCDQCEVGHYNIISGTGCQSCNCDLIGSYNQTCDPHSGQCLCRPGVTGLRCDVCQAYFYGFSTEGCKPCGCDSIGSTTLQCDSTGQCPCYENVEGRRCDHCKENKYERQRGCINCPACYNLIQDAVNIHRSNLTYLDKVLSDIANTPTIIDDQDFKNKLRDVSLNIDGLWRDTVNGSSNDGGKTLSEKVADLNKRLVEIKVLMDQIGNWTIKAGVITSQAAQNVSVAEKTIERAQKVLKDALNNLQTEGGSALSKAIERSTKFGQQSEQMSTIARKARRLVEDQEIEVGKLKKLADKAKNTSTEAYDIARDAIGKQKNTTEELRRLKNDLNLTKEKLDLTISETADTKKQVDAVHTDALAILRDTTYAWTIPDSNFEDLKREAGAAVQKANMLRENADDLLRKNNDFLTELGKQIKEAEDILKSGADQQSITDDLLDSADVAKTQAENAVKQGDKTLEEAQSTYRTLKEFDTQVQESKAEAQKALLMTESIEKIIKEAQNMSLIAADSLLSAKHNAVSAKDNAIEAQNKYASQASMEADAIKRRAEDTKTEASKLKEEAENLSSRVMDTTNKIQELEIKANDNQNLTDKAKTKVGQAKSKGSEALKKVEKAQEDVNFIVRSLNELTDIDEETLDRLEKRLADAETDFINANVDEQLSTLMNMRISQSQLVSSYREEVDKLRRDVENLELIKSSLPQDCWKRTKLEQ